MQFSAHSLGGKLIIAATSILLLSLLLFAVLSGNILRFYSEYQAKRDAQLHVAQLERIYQSSTQHTIQQLQQLTQNEQMLALLTQPAEQTTNEYLRGLRGTLSTALGSTFVDLQVFDKDRKLLATAQDPTATTSPASDTNLLAQALQGKIVTDLRQQVIAVGNAKPARSQWELDIALPVQISGSPAPDGVLLARQAFDDTFARALAEQNEQDGQSGQNIFICLGRQVVGTTLVALTSQLNHHEIAAAQLCDAGQTTIINGTQDYLANGKSVHLSQQPGGSPDLFIAAIEPLYSFSTHLPQNLLILAGAGLFVFALGVIIFTFVTRVMLIRPLRHVQMHAQAIVHANTGMQLELARDQELPMLTGALNALSEALYNESQALTEQTSHLLVMSDALMSTLNLEQLLSEFVTRMAHIMQVKHVALLLYGGEMQVPWAVAHWSAEPGATAEAEAKVMAGKNVTVHADPDGDITMAVTTKMAALPGARAGANTPSSKRSALRPARLSQTGPGTSQAPPAPAPDVRHPRIPHQALRELDMLLARMAISRLKIVYGEDIARIYQERKDTWARLALDSGYLSAIAVPLLLQDRPIGAFLLYTDEVYRISSRDTFLLSTAALQTAMAIQNALLYAEVKEKNVALERANHLKSQFLANVTHELRTPLHSIISYGALILEGFVDGPLTTEQEEHIQFMVRRAEDLSHLVDDMLDLSKIEADRIEIKAEPLKLATCLQEVVDQLKPLARNKNLDLKLQVEAELPLALADGHRVRQVALNLASNALKFTERGGVTLRCRYLSERDVLYVSVTDTGIGISPAALDYIFEAFRQADGSTTRRFGGTGLGLTIARKLIELQGGEIAAESYPGQGTTFSFTLPTVAS